MIPRIHKRGSNVAGLLRYLFGPGKREEHTNAHLVAVWNGAGPISSLEPPILGDGRRDVRRLADLLNQPVRAGHRPPKAPVWHCSIRLHPSDRVLSDQLWATIAAEVMNAVGLAPHSDPRAVRWVAVRHAEDHIHVVATRVRQDRRTAWTNYDYAKAQQACRDLEERFNLYRVAPPGHGTRQWPSPSELNKAQRLHRPSPGRTLTGGRGRRPPVAAREQLRRQVRVAAAAAGNESDFLARLQHAGVRVKLRHSRRNPSQVTGYAVALAGHTTASGQPIWYSGGKLAAELSLPRLRNRWAAPAAERMESGSPVAQLAGAAFAFPPDGVYARAQRLTRQAAEALRTADPAQAQWIAREAADLLTATAHRWEGHHGGPLSEAAELFDRAAHHHRVLANHDRRVADASRRLHSVGLRGMARLIHLSATVTQDEDTAATLKLLYTIAVLADTMADLREQQHRVHQAQAARQAAAQLRTWTPPAPTSPSQPTRTTPSPTVTAGRTAAPPRARPRRGR